MNSPALSAFTGSPGAFEFRDCNLSGFPES